MKKVMTSCLGLLVCLDLALPLTRVQAKQNTDEYLVEDQRTHMRKQNYVRQQRGFEKGALADGLGVAYTVESYDPESDEIPTLIFDYANMIRNDIILLDNSVETRTRKRGDTKVKKYNEAVMDPPCSCEYNKRLKDLGEGFFPRFVEERNCTTKLCSPNYSCQPSLYELTVLKEKENYDRSSLNMPKSLAHMYVALKKPVTVACLCTSDFVDKN
ncbi:prothoracicotropic hormone-like isoform X3 [Plutella xylostella]|uniref:Prothoracicotrophic hormone mRNA n=1 Tax=Plutella xylostella TaxID=51655 RepID=A0A0C5BQ63_PLUXY|nr:prothoracicotropic hormone-like precursor [Plutella xylostella]XP_048485109.1 prothoracicotropic hormone-like isoform X3 [Plutella xylostella]AJM76777.1 prothoracicotrophic hormone [Plutella xylostella]